MKSLECTVNGRGATTANTVGWEVAWQAQRETIDATGGLQKQGKRTPEWTSRRYHRGHDKI